jgi:hypothetical protein
VIQIVEALDEEVVCLVNVLILAITVVEEVSGESALFSNLLVGEEVCRFFAISGRGFGDLVFRHG